VSRGLLGDEPKLSTFGQAVAWTGRYGAYPAFPDPPIDGLRNAPYRIVERTLLMQELKSRTTNESPGEDLTVVRALEQCDRGFRTSVAVLAGLFGVAWGSCAYVLIGFCLLSGTAFALAIAAAIGIAGIRIPRLGVRSDDAGLEVRGPWRTVVVPWSQITGVGWGVYPALGPLSVELLFPVFFVSGRRLPVIVPIRHTDIASSLEAEPNAAIIGLETDAQLLGVAYHTRVPNMSPGMLTNIALAATLGLPIAVILVGVFVCRIPT
jgi:hypothetical protein